MDFSTVLPHSVRSLDFSSFIESYRERLRNVFRLRADIDALSVKRGLPPFAMREIQSSVPLSVFIPEAYNGRGGHVHECLSMLEASSYESLALSLTMGINGALFLQPLTRYGNEAIKAPIFKRFIEEQNMGGLMITEPNYGSDALNMRTSFTEHAKHYHMQGVKHWAGLTGWADFWLLTARRKDQNGQLSRDIDFFVCDVNHPDQLIEVEEYYQNLGLYMIPYGRNKIDIRVPKDQRLEPTSTGIKMMLDVLHRSRMQFPGMGMGFLRRMLDEAVKHCRERYVGGSSLFSYDQVKKRISRLQAWYTACSAMCAYTSEQASMDRDLSKESVPANAIKTVLTDFMQEASQSLLQLTGAKGFRLDHIAGRATVDSRPFQIFEGSNDILYQQISEAVLKMMRRMKQTNLYEFLKTYSLTERAADHFKDVLSFDINLKLPQRKLVELGRMLGRIISMDLTIRLGERGFHADLIANSLNVLKEDVEETLSTFMSRRLADVVDDYLEESAWLNFVRPKLT